MSGTSLDGLDLAYCHFFHQKNQWSFSLVQIKSVSYASELESKLKNAVNTSAEELLQLNVEYGLFLGNEVKKFIAEHSLKVDFIASHGHTVFHQPEKGFTYQIGAGQEIAIRAGVKTICDFRKKDLAFGGQGAPLVPIGDQYLFGEYAACLNLGGIANISFNADDKRVAFDIGMANMLLNHLASKKGKPYDKFGDIARAGLVNQQLLKDLNALPYFKLPYPKSLGYEWFLSNVLPLINASNSSIEDKMCTAVEHEAFQIGNVLKKETSTKGALLITGGGAFNTYLIERIKANTPPQFKVVVPDAHTINFKEAIIFAFMGVLRDRAEINCLASVTGALQDSCGGEMFYPN